MSGVPGSQQMQESYGGATTHDGQKLHLNAEQLQHLLGRLSSDEQKEIQDTLRQCTNEVTMTRGIPFTAITLGSLYFARTRLPPKYHFGPKGWPFYAIMGIGAFTAANVFSMGMCRERIQPKIAELWNKYGGATESTTNYAALRNRNRGGTVSENAQGDQARRPTWQERVNAQPQPQSAVGEDAIPSLRTAQEDDTYAPRMRHYPQTPRQDTFAYSDTFISGTPSGPRADGFVPTNSGGNGKSQYGDVGFS